MIQYETGRTGYYNSITRRYSKHGDLSIPLGWPIEKSSAQGHQEGVNVNCMVICFPLFYWSHSYVIFTVGYDAKFFKCKKTKTDAVYNTVLFLMLYLQSKKAWKRQKRVC